MKMFNGNLQKHNFNMGELKVFDAFSGIGALHQSLKELGIPISVTNISEIDVDAIISYAGIHIDNFDDLIFEYPSEDIMKEWLLNRNIGYSFEKQKSVIPRLKRDKLYKVYKASILLNNLGDISKINCEDIEDFDLMNFSFSCTDISNAGKKRGMTNEDGTPTRSGLYVYGMEIIKKKKPKYIMIENVKGLIQKKFIDDFYSIINELDNVGYNCYYPKKENGQPTCLNAKDYGIPQNRERIFIICIRKDIDNSLFNFPQGFDSGLKLKDFLEDTVDEKYYLSQQVLEGNQFIDKKDRIQTFRETKNYIQWDTSGKQYNSQVDRACYEYGYINTIPASLTYDKCKVITKEENNLRIRKLTSKECWRLMGFTDECFEKAKALGVVDTALYKQAGNSIVINCLYYIFKELFKEYIV